MSEMIERVSAAVDKAMREGFFTTGSDGMTMQRHIARAAIEAMREPDTKMLKVAHVTWFKPHLNPHSDPKGVRPHFKELWQAQIDAALKP